MDRTVDLSHPRAFVNGFAFDFFARLWARDGLYWHEPSRLTPDGEGFWVVSRHRDAAQVLRDAAHFSSAGGGGRRRGGTSIADAEVDGESLSTSGGAGHERFRALAEQCITEAWLRSCEAAAHYRAQTALDHALNLGSFDFVRVTARELGSQVLFDLLGIPEVDWARIMAWTWESGDRERAREGETRRRDYFHGLVAAKRTQPGLDALSALIRARLPEHPKPQLTASEAVAFVNLIFPIGAGACASAMAGAVKAFGEAPEQYERLLSDRSALDSSVEEILRWSTPALYARRTARSELDLGNTLIRAGDKVTAWLASANRDERVFENPDRFDVARAPNPHLSFGRGPHACLGAGVTRLTLRIFLEAACERVARFELTGDAVWTADNRFYGLERLPVRLIGK